MKSKKSQEIMAVIAEKLGTTMKQQNEIQDIIPEFLANMIKSSDEKNDVFPILFVQGFGRFYVSQFNRDKIKERNAGTKQRNV